MKNNQSWQERIIKRFREKFIHIDTVEGYKTCNTKADIADLEKFLLQEGEKIRKETIEEIRKGFMIAVETNKECSLDHKGKNPHLQGLIAHFNVILLDKLKSDSEGE